MCSIIAGYKKETILRLAEQNRYRGEHSCSITYINIKENQIVDLRRKFGAFSGWDNAIVDIPHNCYCVVHQQAPTGNIRDFSTIHPAHLNGHLLWHNGILQPSTVFILGEKYHSINWDSELLLHELYFKGKPPNLAGSFACLYWIPNDGLYAFRNEIAPLFFDSDLNISSTKFDNSIPLPPNRFYKLDFDKRMPISTNIVFETVGNPYV